MSARYNQPSDALQIAGCGSLAGLHPALKMKSLEGQRHIYSIFNSTGSEMAALWDVGLTIKAAQCPILDCVCVNWLFDLNLWRKCLCYTLSHRDLHVIFL